MLNFKLVLLVLVSFLFCNVSGWELSLNSPSKINLFLRIMGRRENGYHDLASLFQAINLSDSMKFSRLPKTANIDIMTCSDNFLKVDDSNLVIKGLNLMRKKTGISQFFEVYLDKKVPLQAGLGGGSGNAATAMFAFNLLCGKPASILELEDWSGDIGSDISFFFSSGTAYCTGRGEVVRSLPQLPDASHVKVHVFKPAEGLSTALVFKNLDLKTTLSGPDPEILLANFQNNGVLFSAESGSLINDLQPPAFSLKPKLEKLYRDSLLLPKVSGVSMSGSGTSVYALQDNRQELKPEDIETLMAKQDPMRVRHFPCDFINRGPHIEDWYP